MAADRRCLGRGRMGWHQGCRSVRVYMLCFCSGVVAILFSFFVRVADLACGVIVACAQGDAVVIVGNAKRAYVELIFGLSVWIAINVSCYLPKFQ